LHFLNRYIDTLYFRFKHRIVCFDNSEGQWPTWTSYLHARTM